MPPLEPAYSTAFPDEELFRFCLMKAIVEASEGTDRVALWSRELRHSLAARLARPDHPDEAARPNDGGDRAASMPPTSNH